MILIVIMQLGPPKKFFSEYDFTLDFRNGYLQRLA